jgi:C4-dicarboxylate-binding protein DctP
MHSKKEVKLPKYVTLTNHGYLGYIVIANKKFWRNLPPEIRVQLRTAMEETTIYANKLAQQQNEWDLVNIKKSGKTIVYELTEAEKTAWHEALLPMQKEMEDRIGEELMTAVHQAIDNQED